MAVRVGSGSERAKKTYTYKNIVSRTKTKHYTINRDNKKKNTEATRDKESKTRERAYFVSETISSSISEWLQSATTAPAHHITDTNLSVHQKLCVDVCT